MNLQGLNKQQVEESRQKHGANTLTQIPPEPLWKKILEGFKDPMIMILLVALVIQVVLCFMGEAHWYEPVGILIAIMIANRRVCYQRKSAGRQSIRTEGGGRSQGSCEGAA